MEWGGEWWTQVKWWTHISKYWTQPDLLSSQHLLD